MRGAGGSRPPFDMFSPATLTKSSPQNRRRFSISATLRRESSAGTERWAKTLLFRRVSPFHCSVNITSPVVEYVDEVVLNSAPPVRSIATQLLCSFFV